MDTFQAIIIAIIEGLTEFLPISSTGHMALALAFMGNNKESFSKLFEIIIQFAAILSVVILYWNKFFDFRKTRFYFKLTIAILPALFFGALLKHHIDAILEKPMIIAIILLLGGILLLFVDNWFKNPIVEREEDITNKQAFTIGCFQVLSIIFPGLSRSAATIIGGMQQKLTRAAAAEFSFFLAVPTMMAASIKSLWDVYQETPEVLNTDNLQILLLGSFIAFIVAILAIKFFIQYLQRNGFKIFGIYRIIVGFIILLLIYTGHLSA